MTQIERIIKKIFPNRKVGKTSRYFNSRPVALSCGCSSSTSCCVDTYVDSDPDVDALANMYPPIMVQAAMISDPTPTMDEFVDTSIDPNPSECGCSDEDDSRRCCSSSYNYDYSSSSDSSSSYDSSSSCDSSCDSSSSCCD